MKTEESPNTSIKAAVFVAQDLQIEEFEYPYEKLTQAGIDVEVIVAPKRKYPKPTSKDGKELWWHKTAQEVVESGKLLYDLLVIPGGFAPEVMRLDPELLAIVRYNIDKDSLIASICHGTQVLLSARNLPKGMRLTGYIGTKHDIENAGYVYPHEELVIERNIITCSHYKYNEQFVNSILQLLSGRGLYNNAAKCIPSPYNIEYAWNSK